MEPPSRPPISQDGISSELWDTHKKTMAWLFMPNGRNLRLSEVATIMEQEYHFRAT
jgi:hypothetical protein